MHKVLLNDSLKQSCVGSGELPDCVHVCTCVCACVSAGVCVRASHSLSCISISLMSASAMPSKSSLQLFPSD